MRGQQDRSVQIMSKTQGWDPTAIVGAAYDADRHPGLIKDIPGSDSSLPSDYTVSPETKPWESPDVRPQGHPEIKHGDPFPGKPL